MSDDRIELYRSRLDSTTESSSHRPLQRIAFSSLYKVKEISSGQHQSTSVERTTTKMANAIARKAMAQSVTSSSLAASGWNQVFGNGAAQGPTPKVSFWLNPS